LNEYKKACGYMEKKDKIQMIIKIIFLTIILSVIVYFSVKYAPGIIKLIRNTEKFKQYINSFGVWGVLVYILFEIIHVIIIIIPGEFLQIAGGYIYGTVLGTVYTFIGIFIGVVIVFFSTRIFGYSVIKIFIPKDKLEKYNYIINSPKAEIIMFLLFLIPGIPKDALTYIAGLTPIKPVQFLILCSIARFPGILGSAFIGARLQSENYITVIVVSAIALVLFVLGVIFQKRIVDFLHNLRHKKNPDTDEKNSIK
jgi:uncharacterized membrane protein YdjX (TVP38/TMEM64 family)